MSTSPESKSAPHVFAAINAVQAALAKEGITKNRKNTQQGYSFRGIDDIFNALSSMLAENQLVMLPKYSDRLVTERETKTGGTLFSVSLKGEFTFTSAKDGSSTTATLYGEAMDSGDKATNKAMSAAYKYAALQAFCIPTEGDNDADATTHELAAKQATKAAAASGPGTKQTTAKPNGGQVFDMPMTDESKKAIAAFRASEAGEKATVTLLKHWKLESFDGVSEGEARDAIAWIKTEIAAATAPKK